MIAGHSSDRARAHFPLALTDHELEVEWDRAWKEEFESGHQGGSIYRFTFHAHLYAAEKDLQKLGQLDLFRKTQRLPDYPRAEDAVKRGWANWLWQEFRIRHNEAGDYLTLNQFLLLYGLRFDESAEARQERIHRCSKLLAESKARGEREFFRRLQHVMVDPPRKGEGYREFIHVLLANWLTAFWWLMPLKAVAHDLARTQGNADDGKAIHKFNQNLRQITTRRTPPSPGAFFSAGWNGVFYSSHPALIDHKEDGSPHFSATGRRLLG